MLNSRVRVKLINVKFSCIITVVSLKTSIFAASFNNLLMSKHLVSVRLSDATLSRLRFCAKHLKLSNTRIIENAIDLYFHDAKCDFDLYQFNV